MLLCFVRSFIAHTTQVTGQTASSAPRTQPPNFVPPVVSTTTGVTKEELLAKAPGMAHAAVYVRVSE